MDCRVVVEAAVPVYDVGTADEAVRIAISKTGGMLNPDLSYVEINVGSRTSPAGEALEPAFVVADEALVALELEMTVFNVQRTEHAARIARKEIGQRMHDIPLDVLDVSVVDEGNDDDEPEEGRNSGNEANDGNDDNDSANSRDSRNDRSSGDDGDGGGNGEGRIDGATDARADDTGDGGDGRIDEAGSSTDDGSDTDNDGNDTDDDSDTDDMLPEFEDLLDE